jgi:hypothetical protein
MTVTIGDKSCGNDIQNETKSLLRDGFVCSYLLHDWYAVFYNNFTRHPLAELHLPNLCEILSPSGVFVSTVPRRALPQLRLPVYKLCTSSVRSL